jgi:Zn-dependent protease/CBS domain-containing protein
MPWSLSIGKIGGTEIRIHVTFLLFLAWIWAASYMSGGADAAWSGLLFMVLLFLCVLVHEYGHILTARAFGISTRDVTLLPIGGVARLERFPEEPREEFLITIAGPMVNVAIALALMLAGANPSPDQLAAADITKVALIDRLAAVNVVLAAFNLIPAFPMDGGRVLRALLARKYGFVRATEIAASIGQWCAFAFGFIGLFFNPMLTFIAIFIYLAATSEARLAQLRGMSRGVPVTATMMTEYKALSPSARIEEAIETLLRTSQTEFPVVDKDGRLVGVLGRSDMIKALKQDGPNTLIGNVMTREVPTIDHRRCLDEAFRVLMEKSAPAVGVVDATGRLKGLITSETVGDMLMVRDAVPKGFRFGERARPAGA